MSDASSVASRRSYSFGNQFKALWIKQTRLQMRQYKSNICLLSFPLVLMLAIILFQMLVDSVIQSSQGEFTAAIRRPAATPFNFIYPVSASNCSFSDPFNLSVDVSENGTLFYTRPPDHDLGSYGGVPKNPAAFAFLGNNFLEPNGNISAGFLGNMTTPITSFVAYVGRVDGEGRVDRLCFRQAKLLYPLLLQRDNKNAIDSAILGNWSRKTVAGAFDFRSVDVSNENSTGVVDYSIYFNRTLTQSSEVPILMNMVTNALWRMVMGSTPMSQLTNVGKMDFPRARSRNGFDIISLGGPNLYIYLFQLLLPTMLQTLVFEKENKLREIMKMMGTKPFVYFLVTYLFMYLLYVLLSIVTVCIALALGFVFWLYNDFLTYFILLALWGHTLVAFSFLLSVFFTRTRTATVIGYSLILASGLLAQNLIRNYFVDEWTPEAAVFAVGIFPPFAFFRGLMALSAGVSFNGNGMRFSEISLKEYRLNEVYYFLVVEWAVCLILAFYFENVLPIGPGVKKHPLFFLPSFCWRKKSKDIKLRPAEDEPDDVAEERRRVEAKDNNDSIKIIGLNKVYAGQSGVGPKIAVSNLSLGIRRGECVGFLGPNGAGKSTTINMLCGYLRPSGGEVRMNGLSIRDDIDAIHLQMGVCPQEDVLWDDLTGAEHLEFYGRLKNLQGEELTRQVDYWLEQVNLHSKKTRVKHSSEYSGGMKRRLSVAIALIGDPSVVLLDEPTTGLDPASRRDLWKVIINYRPKCSMMLTTHSMEEAEALCQRLGIFVASRLKTIGASAELKEKYGQYYKILVTTPPGKEGPAHALLKSIAPNIRLINSLAGTSSFEVSRKEIKLSTVFVAIQRKRRELFILDWGISNTTLEEVFLRITEAEAEDETAAFAKSLASKRGCCGCSGRKKKASASQSAEAPQKSVSLAPLPMVKSVPTILERDSSEGQSVTNSADRTSFSGSRSPNRSRSRGRSRSRSRSGSYTRSDSTSPSRSYSRSGSRTPTESYDSRSYSSRSRTPSRSYSRSPSPSDDGSRSNRRRRNEESDSRTKTRSRSSSSRSRSRSDSRSRSRSYSRSRSSSRSRSRSSSPSYSETDSNKSKSESYDRSYSGSSYRNDS